MTKTQTKLIELARQHPHRTISVSFGYQTRRRFGTREADAAGALLKAGVFTLVHRDKGTPLFKNGYGINGYVWTVTYRMKEER